MPAVEPAEGVSRFHKAPSVSSADEGEDARRRARSKSKSITQEPPSASSADEGEDASRRAR
jgi:hypothetical protein